MAPSAYPPRGVGLSAADQSPFLTGVNTLLAARQCLANEEDDTNTKPTDKARIHGLAGEIDAYFAALRGGMVTVAPNGTASSQAGGASKGAAQKAPTETAAQASTAAVTPTAMLIAVLAADDLVQTLGVDPATGLLRAGGPWQHVLLLRALESGGTVAKSGNIFGSSTHYSGGAVGTYALFTLQGELECSGNVYDYGGSIPADTFQAELRRHRLDPGSQSIFERHGCVKPPGQ